MPDQRERAAEWEEHAGGTHNLQLDALAVEFDGADLEVDTDRGDEARSPGIVAESEEQARLADACSEEIRQRVPRFREGEAEMVPMEKGDKDNHKEAQSVLCRAVRSLERRG